MRNALFAATALLVAGAASAEETVSYEVNASDLNLAQEADAKILLNRIVVAARKVCDVRPGFRFPQQRRADDECVAETVENAVKSVNVATLNTVFAASEGVNSTFKTSALENAAHGWSDRA
ncbi:MAG: UrcA family protein [Pseudomonadota bacterium]